eukprot:5665662-Amphidinium_carterae.1
MLYDDTPPSSTIDVSATVTSTRAMSVPPCAYPFLEHVKWEHAGTVRMLCYRVPALFFIRVKHSRLTSLSARSWAITI